MITYILFLLIHSYTSMYKPFQDKALNKIHFALLPNPLYITEAFKARLKVGPGRALLQVYFRGRAGIT